MQTHYDYIILGGGLSGLTLAIRLSRDAYFKNKSIALVEASENKGNDRTWSFWETTPDLYEPVVKHHWTDIIFKSDSLHKEIAITPYSYKQVESIDLYAFAKAELSQKPQFNFISAQVTGVADTGAGAMIETTKGSLTADKIFSSLLEPSVLKEQQKHQLINQHFLGWFVQTETPFFDPSKAHFMDFTVPQKGNCRFMYVLPTSTTTALFEYTLFSERLLEEGEYEQAIEEYLDQKGIMSYTIERKEQGCIPMTSFRFDKHNTANILHIGTAGGWTKASTGYTFKNALKKSAQLVSFLKEEKPLNRFPKRNRFWFYDLWLLDVLYRKNHLGATIFSEMFKHNSSDQIFKFLDEETSFKEELKIMLSLPKLEFVKAVFSRLGAMFK